MALQTPLTTANIVIIVLLVIAIALFIVVLGLLIWDLVRPIPDNLSTEAKDLYNQLAFKMYNLTDLIIEYLTDPNCSSDIVEQISGDVNTIVNVSTKYDPNRLRARQTAWNNLINGIKNKTSLSTEVEALSQQYFDADAHINQHRLQNMLYNWAEYIKSATEAKKNQNCIATGLARQSALENASEIAKILI